MTKGLYHQLRQTWKKPNPERLRELMIEWRKDNTIKKIDKPTRLDRAHSLGYKAKKGFVIARVRIQRGGRKRPRPSKARRSKRMTPRKTVKMNYKWIAEQRTQKKFPNLEVLNSYPLAKDGRHYFYEVILVDYSKPEIKKDKKINWITKKTNQHRVHRGLTSSGKKSRGLRKKSPENKNRPSVRAGKRRGK
ncbi:50S ribosomal protein L15e [Candidatus Pacearchaeota archaeon]|nr:50S ribosomal protein L15e [Candidatus Pacearchaeota archaeon]MBD3282768.1 50S ribosomal protein L15e [Candidatus Pacearchaeota archaeon]